MIPPNVRFMKPKDIAKLKCKGCNKAQRKVKGEWNVVWKQGLLTGVLCPNCQTPEQNMEAEINMATMDYSKAKLSPFGRMVAPHIAADDVAE